MRSFIMPDLRKRPDIIYAVSYIARSHAIDQVIALDDFDVDTAGALRDHLCLPGMGESHARHFRDKLTMRTLAQNAGIPIPEFTPVFNYDQLRQFMEQVPPPWLLKPRSEASAMGITTIHHPDEIWPVLEKLGDAQSYLPAGAIPARGRVPRGRAGGRGQDALCRDPPLRQAADERLPGRRRLHHAHARPALGGSEIAGGAQPARSESTGARSRALPTPSTSSHKGWKVLFPGVRFTGWGAPTSPRRSSLPPG